jgi:hypothetical protein
MMSDQLRVLQDNNEHGVNSPTRSDYAVPRTLGSDGELDSCLDVITNLGKYINYASLPESKSAGDSLRQTGEGHHNAENTEGVLG